MKILVVTLCARFKPHFETDLELLQKHLDAGDEVAHLYCNCGMLACEDNVYHDIRICRECVATKRAGLLLLNPRVSSQSFLNQFAAIRDELSTVKTEFDSVDRMKEYRLGGFDIGWAVLSSIISLRRDPEPFLAESKTLVAKLAISAWSIYCSVQNHLEHYPVNRVYVFNGRLATCRAVLRACQSRGIPCWIHERGHDVSHYELYENVMPVDRAYTENEVRRCWMKAGLGSNRKEIAEAYFHGRAKGVVQSWYSYVSNQKEGALPLGWDPAKRNIVIFNSSEDECASIGDEWRHTLYSGQLDGIRKVVESLGAHARDMHVYLRMHPNLIGVDNANTRALRQLRGAGFTFIPDDDPVSTYALIKNADKVLTFGSTVGIEAVFWGKPSILAGPSFYTNLGGTYNPTSHEELVAMTMADLPPKDKEPALMYGYYLNSYGTPYKYFVPNGLFDGTFKGKRVVPATARSIIVLRKVHNALRSLIYKFCNILFMLSTRWRLMRTFRAPWLS